MTVLEQIMETLPPIGGKIVGYIDAMTKLNVLLGVQAPLFIQYMSQPQPSIESRIVRHIASRLEAIHRKYASTLSSFNMVVGRPIAHKATVIGTADFSPELNVHIVRHDGEAFSFTILPHELPNMMVQFQDTLINALQRDKLDKRIFAQLVDKTEGFLAFMKESNYSDDE